MKQQVPHRPEYVEVLAKTTAPCDVVSFLLEAGAVAAKDVACAAHIRQGIAQAIRHMVGVPNKERDERYLFPSLPRTRSLDAPSEPLLTQMAGSA